MRDPDMVIKLRYDSPGSWRKAKCSTITVTRDYDPFFEEDDGPAIDYCNGDADGVVCPIRNECLLYALANSCQYGVWGGCGELTRKAMRKRWPLKRGTTPRPEWEWMTQQDALGPLDPVALLQEEDFD